MQLKNLSLLMQSIKEKISKLEYRDLVIPEKFKTSFTAKFVGEQSNHSYSNVIWQKYGLKLISYRDKKDIYASNYWFLLASILAEFIISLHEHKKVFKSIFSTRIDEIAIYCRDNTLESVKAKYGTIIQSYFDQESGNQVDLANFYEFLSSYEAWGGAKTIDRDDYYVSPILKAGNLVAVAQAAVADLAYLLAFAPEILEIFNSEDIEALNSEENLKKISSNRSANQASLPKPFLLLAGISGTGKSRFVREQALAHGASLENFALVAVRPDWHEPSDLLGYVSRIGGSTQYVATDFLKFLVRAWVDATTSASSKEALVYKAVDAMVPHWLCLDEMNLAPVEQYFSDYLAVIESRKWLGGQYQCGSLLKPLAFQGVDAAALRESLGVADAAHDGLWAYFAEHGIAVPPNLIVAGTVNMDETTHGFSRKVLDRAFTIDFGAFYPNDFEQYFKPTTTVNTLTFPVLSQVTQQDLAGVLADSDGAKSTAFLQALNGILAGTPFELAFRALNELLIAVVCFNPKDEIELQAVWDDFLMTKVLPRIAGDMGKLSSGQDTSVLQRLSAMLGSSHLLGIWQGGGERVDGGDIKLRPDFLRTDSATGQPCQIACRAEAKMAWMQARLEANSFTSFWP